MNESLHVVWFKRDLRIRDHRALAAAARLGPVLPLYVVETEYWRQPDVSARHWAFARESLEQLRVDLGELGQPLVVRQGDVIAILDRIHRKHTIGGLHSHEETGNAWTFERDRNVAAWCRRQGIPWHEQRQHGVIRGLKQRNGWSGRWDRFMAEQLTPRPAALPPLPGIDPGRFPEARELGLTDDGCTERQTGGSRSAHDLLASFLAERGRSYRRAMSSPVSAWTECSRLSPHLAWGTISIREVSQRSQREQQRLRSRPVADRTAWRESLESFDGRLHWHCHFMQKLEREPELEFKNLHPAYDGLRQSDDARLAAWQQGETGLPFVDACMRSLQATGWLNFRMRAMLMSFASYHLWLDWKKPGEHLARLFTDYEPGIHWPQVQMQSGTTGINTPRIYNPVKQGYDQDPHGVFVRRWLPELDDVPDEFVHEPWRWESSREPLGDRYPRPVVNHLAAAHAAKQAIWGVRKGREFRQLADRVQDRHGSRRSGGRRLNRNRQLPLSIDAKDIQR